MQSGCTTEDLLIGLRGDRRPGWIYWPGGVDPETGSFVGLNAQCVQFSPTHNAVIVSMGNVGNCGTAWSKTRQAIVSRDHPLYNATRHIPAPELQARSCGGPDGTSTASAGHLGA
eukprot:SAG25_NODE_52_length_18732_cov_99.030484_5_plen_115_part_00